VKEKNELQTAFFYAVLKKKDSLTLSLRTPLFEHNSIALDARKKLFPFHFNPA
jgi:hypothetical protein